MTSQQALFLEHHSARPHDLRYLPDFISQTEERELLAHIDAQPWLIDLKRRVQHYGWRYDYTARRVSNDAYLGQLPEWLAVYAQRLVDEGLFDEAADQVIVNEYQPGQGIAPHIDCVPCFGGKIASVSIGSSCMMDFTHTASGEKASQWLEPRSLLLFSGEARYQWKHGIAARKSDVVNGRRISRSRRLSLTFRTVVAAREFR